ncbi:MAG TPA: YlxR family protein [bacterium]|nr:YlxR family protein [bacterium]
MAGRKHTPIRTCLGCLGKFPQQELVRFVSSPRGIDVGNLPGRGLYLCKNPACFEKALRRKGREQASWKRLDAPSLERLREAVAQARHAGLGASGGGAIG